MKKTGAGRAGGDGITRTVLSQTSDRSLLASLTLLYQPEHWFQSIGERISIERTELTRHVKMNVRIPDTDLGLAGLSTGKASGKALKRFFLPLLTPRKHVLLDLREIDVGPGHNCRLANHDEHVEVSKAMVRARFSSIFLNANYMSQGHEYVDQAKQVMEALAELAEMGRDDAVRRLEKFFPGARNLDYSLSVVNVPDGTVLPNLNRLYLLCRLLAERYLKLLVIEGPLKFGNELEVRYSHRERFRSSPKPLRQVPLEESRIRLRDQLGASPSSIRVPLPLARRTNHYRFRFVAPQGHFFHRARFLELDTDGRTTRRPIHGGLHGPDKTQPSASLELGGGSEAYMLLVNGSRTDGQVDGGFIVYEMPPGSTGYAFTMAAALTVVMAGLLAILTWSNISRENMDIPALIVAFGASTSALSSPFMPRTDLYSTPILTRLSLLATAALGNLFALWVVARGATIPSIDQLPEEALRTFVRFGGLGAVILMVVISAGLGYRLSRSASKYASARSQNYDGKRISAVKS